MPLSREEAVDMIAVYFECLGNAVICARIYADRYPQRRRYESRTIINRLACRFRATGSINRPVYRRRHRVVTEEKRIDVLAYVQVHPQVSTRVIARQLGISPSTDYRILKEEK